MKNSRAQISVEYLILIGFIITVVIVLSGAGLVYSANIKDQIRIKQIQTAANKIIHASEEVFYAGEPSKIPITIYLPSGINNITIEERSLIFNFETNTGTNTISFESAVPLTGIVQKSEGLKKIQVVAQSNDVNLSPA